MSPPRFINILAGSVDIRCNKHCSWLLIGRYVGTYLFKIYFSLIVTKKNISVQLLSISFKFLMMWLAMG